ncbi:MAG: HlyD family efflux transporter periplasmic adaptor subunit [Pseudomonadales bacterium]|nr:HlyD family efflux transporter periplasmic adaptor subunit [Pseudomonadales bacterium]
MVEQAAKGQSRQGKRRRVLLLLACLFLTLGAAAFVYHPIWGQFEESTDDAYVNGHLIELHAQVPGVVTVIDADDTQLVHEGGPLLELDATDAKVHLQQAEASYRIVAAEVNRQCLEIVSDTAATLQKQAQLQAARDDLARRLPLAHSPSMADEELAHARDAVRIAEETLKETQEQAAAAHARVVSCDPEHQPSLQQARAAYVAAYLSLERTRIKAPVSGMVARRHVQVGQQVSPGDSLMSIVPLDSLWVDANLKESQLRHVRIGQKAKVVSDLYGSQVVYPAVVEGVAAGSGSAFSLLPPQNAVGNWIKVVQRVAVRLRLDKAVLEQHPLRVGLSTLVTIDTHDRDGSLQGIKAQPGDDSTTIVYAQQLDRAEKAADRLQLAQAHRR